MIRTEVGGITVSIDTLTVDWCGGLAIDADGSPYAYAPADSGKAALDHLANAGSPGKWYSLVTDNDHADGTPFIQGASDPAPGFYVSSTALQDKSLPKRDPRRYVDSGEIPYLSVPPELLMYLRLGDVAIVRNLNNHQQSAAIIADVGPHNKLGEGSIMLALSLGINANPKKGGCSSGIAVTAFRHSSRGWPRTVQDIALQATTLSLKVA